MKKRIIATLTTGLLLSLSAQAELLHDDWLAAGDQRITTDTVTGLEWLKFTGDRSNMTLNETRTETMFGGLYEGWRIPTGEEVEGFISAVLPEYSMGTDTTSGNRLIGDAVADRAQTWLGVSSPANNTFSYGLHYRSGDAGTVSLTGVRTDTNRLYEDHGAFGDSNYRNTVYNVYLVNDGSSSQSFSGSMAETQSSANDVSAPLAAAGLLGLFGLMGRRKQMT